MSKKVSYKNVQGIPADAPEGRTQSVFLNGLGTQEVQPVRPTYTHSDVVNEVNGEVEDSTYGLFINFLKSKASVWLGFGDAKKQGIMRQGEDGLWVMAHKELGFEANVTAGVAGKFIVPAEVLEEA